MKKYSVKVLSLFFLLLFIGIAFRSGDANADDNQKTFLWKVKAGTHTVYILGSIHFMKKDIYPLNRKIEDAFAGSDVLVVEANIDDVNKIDVGKFIDKSFYAADDSLDRHISGETYERVKKEFEVFGIPAWLVNKQKPWFLALTLESLELAKLGFDPSYGIDMHFLSEASGKKKIKEIESIDYQINLLSGFSDSEQEALLLSTLKDLRSYKKEVDRIVQAWITGDTRGMELILRENAAEDRRIASIYDKLFYERNTNMVSKIEEYLKTGQTYFVVVGAGHLLGDRGIINFLKQKGYQVEQL